MPMIEFANGTLDRARMNRDRMSKLQDQLDRQSTDALLLLSGSHVTYATGATIVGADATHAGFRRPVAVVVRGDDQPWLFTHDPASAPIELAPERVRGAVWPDLDEGVHAFAPILDELLGGRAGKRMGIDEQPAAVHRNLDVLAGGAELVDASSVIGPAKLCKTADELECIRRSQRIAEEAMRSTYEILRPGLRQTELTGYFLRRLHELGADANAIDPIWTVMPHSLAAGPWTTHGDLAFPLPTTDRILAEGDLLWVDSGSHYGGYASDFGRTWIVSDDPRPSPALHRHFERYLDIIDAVCARLGPGVTNGDLCRAAIEANGGTKPWMPHFYLAHSLGIESAEMPLVGTDLGEAFDDSYVLEPGMVLVLEPCTWEDGVGGYRGEEIVAVTDDGFEKLSGDYPYDPFVTP